MSQSTNRAPDGTPRGAFAPRAFLGWCLASAGAGLAGWMLSSRMLADDPFRPLLFAMPGTGLALWAILQSLRRTQTWTPGARETAPQAFPPTLAASILAAAGFTLLTLQRDRLGLPSPNAPLAAAGLVLLAHSIVTMVPALRRSLGNRLGTRPHPAFALVPLVVYCTAALWSTAVRPPDGDEPYYLLVAHSLAFDLDTDLVNNYAEEDWQRFLDRPLEPQPGDPRGADGAQYSRHNMLLPLLLAPFYAIGGRAGAVFVIACAAGLLAWMTLRLAARVLPDQPRAGFLIWLTIAFSPPLLLYSHQIWVEIPAALALSVAIDRWWSIRAHGVRGWRDIAILGVALAVLPLLKLRFLLLAAPVLALVCTTLHRRLDSRRATRLLAFAGTAAVAVLAGLLIRNQIRFGNPLKMHAWSDLAPVDRPLFTFLLGGSGTFFDCAFGLFASAPIWLLLVPAVAFAATDRSRRSRDHDAAIPPRQLLRDIALISVPYLLAIAPRLEWYGGWSPPFRYPFVLLPLLALLLLPLFARRTAGVRMLAGGLGLATFLLSVLWLSVPGWTYNLADGGNHLLDAGSALLGADLGRFFPSMVRPRLATWLWPALSLLTIPLCLMQRPRRLAQVWGAAALMAAAALVVLLARVVPTHTIELEDGQVRTRGGHVSPPTWKIERPRYRAGWTLRRNTQVWAPVVGEGQVRLRMAVRYVSNAPERPFFIEALAGEQPIFRWQAEGDQVWQAIDIGPVDWPANAPLVLLGQAEAAPGQPANGVVVDYVDFFWE